MNEKKSPKMSSNVQKAEAPKHICKKRKEKWLNNNNNNNNKTQFSLHIRTSPFTFSVQTLQPPVYTSYCPSHIPSC
jgi:hypothetical protein